MRPVPWKKGLPIRWSEKEETRPVWSRACIHTLPEAVCRQEQVVDRADFGHRRVMDGQADVAHEPSDPGGAENANDGDAGCKRRE